MQAVPKVNADRFLYTRPNASRDNPFILIGGLVWRIYVRAQEVRRGWLGQARPWLRSRSREPPANHSDRLSDWQRCCERASSHMYQGAGHCAGILSGARRLMSVV
jgi:hypothetical protein